MKWIKKIQKMFILLVCVMTFSVQVCAGSGEKNLKQESLLM